MQLGVRIADIRGNSDGSVELEVELRRAGSQLLATNVVVPMGQTVMLGSAYPGTPGSALILTVRGEKGARELRSSSRRRRAEAEEAFMHAEHAEAEARAAAREGSAVRVEVGPPSVHVIGGRARSGGVGPAPATRAVPARATPAAVPPPSR